MSAEAYTQVAPDSTGRRIETTPVIVPAGTLVTNSDGTKTELTADTVVFRQVVAIGDPNEPGRYVGLMGEDGRGAARVSGADLRHLQNIDTHLSDIKTLLQLALGV